MKSMIISAENRDMLLSDPTSRIEFISHLRQQLGMSIEQACQFCHVGIRSWKDWETLRREMPIATAELFILKLENIIYKKEHPYEGMIIILGEDHISILDVVSGYNFLSFQSINDDYYEIKSMAIDLNKGQPYIHKTIFHKDANSHVISWAINQNNRSESE